MVTVLTTCGHRTHQWLQYVGGVYDDLWQTGCYHDPVLEHDQTLYARFLARLFLANLLTVGEKAHPELGVFFVRKKEW